MLYSNLLFYTVRFTVSRVTEAFVTSVKTSGVSKNEPSRFVILETGC